MSEKHSIASAKRWAKIPKEERSKRMSALRNGYLNKLTDRQRKNIGKKLVKAREDKEK